MWKIKQIAEADYGCEERTADEKLKCLVILEDENGNTKQLEAEDEWLRANRLDEGSNWIDTNIHHGRYNEISPDGTDIYDLKEKAKEHMKNLKKQEDWTKNCTPKNVDIPAFVKKMQDMKAGKEVDWKCPFCKADVVLMENEKAHTVIGCTNCDMRIELENN